MFSCKKTQTVYQNAVSDSAHVSITNISPAISNLLFSVNGQNISLPDSPLSFGNKTFANNIKFSDGINPGTIELPYFNILNGYQSMGLNSDSPSAYFVVGNNFQQGGYYSIFITDTITHGQAQVVIIQDRFAHIFDTTKALIRFLNLSPDAPPMDLWAYPNGGAVGSKILSGCAYLPADYNSFINAGNFTPIDAGLYFFSAINTGTSNILLYGGMDIPPQTAVTIFTKGFLYGTGNNAFDVGAIVYEP